MASAVSKRYFQYGETIHRKSEHHSTISARSRSLISLFTVVRTWKILELGTPDHKYKHPMSLRPTADTAASHPLNDVATDIHATAETLLLLLNQTEQLMHIRR
jgi:hypothetical protein